jgi:uncharacterized protein YndB with AHSA1/START domain
MNATETATRTATAAAAPASALPERALRIETTVNAPVDAVWDLWTTTTGAQTFLAPKANIALEIGGPYEIYFNPADERMTTKGCKLLTYLPRKMLSFEWILPGDMFPDLRHTPTRVIVELHPVAQERTQLTITQLGWGSGPEWDRAYTHMEAGWNMATTLLNQRIAQGAIDWDRQYMMWKQREAAANSAAQ